MFLHKDACYSFGVTFSAHRCISVGSD